MMIEEFLQGQQLTCLARARHAVGEQGMVATDVGRLAVLREAFREPRRLETVAGMNAIGVKELVRALVPNEPLIHGFGLGGDIGPQRRELWPGIGSAAQPPLALVETVLCLRVARGAELIQ